MCTLPEEAKAETVTNLIRGGIMQQQIIEVIKIDDLVIGEFFKLKPESKKVYVRGEYLEEENRYSCTDFDDINRERFFKPETVIHTGFEF